MLKKLHHPLSIFRERIAGPGLNLAESNWNLEALVFKGRGKPDYPEKNRLELGREPATNSTQIAGRRALSPLRNPCSPLIVGEILSDYSII